MKLKEIEGVDGSDYINASFLDVSGPAITCIVSALLIVHVYKTQGYRKKRAYIGAQGKLN